MQIPKINVKQTCQNLKQSLKKTGEQTVALIKTANKNFDTFVSSKGKDPKIVKQIGLGGLVAVAGTVLACLCIKGIVNKVKEVKNK